jgi:hypothetical protein
MINYTDGQNPGSEFGARFVFDLEWGNLFTDGVSNPEGKSEVLLKRLRNRE